MTLTQLFTAIANAIRSKKGTSGTIVAENFPTEIESIVTTPNLQDKSITINSNTTTTIQADTGYDGLDEVSVTTNISGGADLSDYIYDTISAGTSSGSSSGIYIATKKFPIPPTILGTSCKYMFGAYYAPNIDLSQLDMSNITNMSHMFTGSYITSIDLSGKITNKLTNMQAMFYNCPKLKTINLTNCDLSNVTNITNLFYYCSVLVEVLGILDFNKCSIGTSMSNNAVSRCYKLETIYIKNLQYSANFTDCTALSHESLVYLINNLQTVTDKTLTIGATNLAKLTAEEIAVGTAKGWTIQ